MKRIVIILVATLVAVAVGGCGSTTPSSSGVAAQPATTSTTGTTAGAAKTAPLVSQAERKRIEARCPRFGNGAAAVAEQHKCERVEEEGEAALASSKRVLAEGKTEQERLAREAASMTPAERSRIAAENARALKASKELGTEAEHEEAEASSTSGNTRILRQLSMSSSSGARPEKGQRRFAVVCCTGLKPATRSRSLKPFRRRSSTAWPSQQASGKMFKPAS